MNYFIGGKFPFVTEWCGNYERHDVFRTWLVPGGEPPRDVCHRQRFRHLVVTPDSDGAQGELARLQGSGGLWTVGMYTNDVDVQESAVRSAQTIARALSPQSANLRRVPD